MSGEFPIMTVSIPSHPDALEYIRKDIEEDL